MTAPQCSASGTGSATQNKECADANLALLLPNGLTIERDESEALRWSLKAAEQGLAESQADAGHFYARGTGSPVDYEEARRWYGLAAKQGNAAAEYGLGVLYANGFGVDIDLATAAACYRRAA